MDDLKPCPFCGGEAEIHPWDVKFTGSTYFVWCDRCETRGDYYSTKAKAIEAWNMRVERTCFLPKAESNYEQLFGTPERAAKTLSIMQRCELGIIGNCDECEMHDACRVRDGDYNALLEWLRGDA